MAIDFERWNQEFGGKEALKELEETKANSFTEVPDGVYTCKLEKLELGESKKKQPMIKGMFRIDDGKYRKQCLFINQVFTRGFPQHKGLEFLRSLKIFDDYEVDFDGDFEHLNDLLLDMAEEAESAKMLFDVRKSQDGDFSRLEVVEVYG